MPTTQRATDPAAAPSPPVRGSTPAGRRGSAAQRARRRRIIDTTTRLLGERDYEQVQMRDVAEGAGVALGTLYRYFPSKDQLAAEALVQWSSRLETGIVAPPAAGSGSEQRLLDTLQRVVRAFERHPNFFRLIGVLQVSTEPGVVELFRQHGARFTDSLIDTLDGVHPDDASDLAMTASALVFALLQSLMLGHRTVDEVLVQIERSVRLFFSAPRLTPTAGSS